MAPPIRKKTMASTTVRRASGRPYSRADIREKLKLDDDSLQDAIMAEMFPRPDFSALYLASRWTRTTVRTWYSTGGATRLRTWLEERP